jgi:ribose 5-phosphate isomerase A
VIVDTVAIKRLVAETVTDQVVRSGMKIGLGTGSTAIHAVRRVGALLAEGRISDILAVPTSFEGTIEAQRLGIPLRTLNDPDIDGRLDLVIDGADEVDTRTGFLIKGGGGALTIEKLVEYNADMLYVVVDESKLSARLGTLFPVPVEVIPAALRTVSRALEALGGNRSCGWPSGRRAPSSPTTATSSSISPSMDARSMLCDWNVRSTSCRGFLRTDSSAGPGRRSGSAAPTGPLR